MLVEHPIVHISNDREWNFIGRRQDMHRKGFNIRFKIKLPFVRARIIGVAFISWGGRANLAKALRKEWDALGEPERRERIQMMKDLISKVDQP